MGPGTGLDAPPREKLETLQHPAEMLLPVLTVFAFGSRQRARDALPRICHRAIMDHVAVTVTVLGVPNVAGDVGSEILSGHH